MNSLLIEFLGKASFLLAAAWCFHFAVRQGNARWRVLIWRMLLPALCLLMVLVGGAPKVGVPVMPPKEVTPMQAVVVKDQEAPEAVDAPSKTVSVPKEQAKSQPRLAVRAEASNVPAGKMFEWVKLLPWLYAGPVILLFGGLAAAWVRARRLVARALPVPGEIESLYRNVAEDFGVHRAAGAMLSSEVASPILVGWLRPRLLLPTVLGNEGHEQRLRMIFAHESSHLSTRDALWNLLIRSTQILLWFHPLAWGMSAAHGRACEEAADGKAAKYAGDVEGYGDTLAGLALRAHAWQLRATGLPMARAASIPQRLRNLGKNAESRRLGRGKVLGFAGVALVVIGLAAIVTLATRPVDIRGVITDAAGQPVRDALVKICYGGPKVGEGFLCPSIYPDCGKTATTDASGGFRIKDVDPKLDFIVLTAAPGFEGTFQFKVDAQKGLQRFTLNRWTGKIRDGETAIRGRFVDADGKPIAGAIIKAGGGPNEGVAGISAADGTFAVTWKNSGEVSVFLTAPGFAPRRMELKSPLPSELEIRLDRGVRVEGRIVRDGKGLDRTPVLMEDQNYDNSPFEDRPAVLTGHDGRFVFSNVPLGRTVTFYADRFALPGLATGSVSLTTDAASEKISIKDMEAMPALAVHGRIRMPGDQSFPQGSQLILSDLSQGGGYRLITLEGDGSFEVPAFPGEEVEVSLKVPEFVAIPDALGNMPKRFVIKDAQSRVDVKLIAKADARSSKVEGRVVNAQGLPPAKSRVAILLDNEVSYIMDGGLIRSSWDRADVTDEGGKFMLPRIESGGKVIAVGPDGYGECSLADIDKKPITLRPWGRIVGRYAPDGVPVGKRAVRSRMQQGESGEARILLDTRTLSDEQGNFVLEHVPEGEVYVIVGIDTEQLGTVAVETRVEVKSGETTKAALDLAGCTVTGQVAIPSEGAALLDFAKNWSEIQPAGNYSESFGVSFGSDGRFEVRGIQPGSYRMTARVRWKTNGANLADGILGGKSFEVSPGETAVDLGSIEVTMGTPPLAVGTKAPSFDQSALGGGKVRSDDLKGKVLVIQFNRQHIQSNFDEGDYFRGVRKAVNNADGVEYILFAAADSEEAFLKKSSGKSNFWRSCYLGSPEKSSLIKAFHLDLTRNSPIEVIIGADGKIAYIGQNYGEAEQIARAEVGKTEMVQRK
jgi:beta-lactamase regulating signal transducer with metallopeptidase domain